MRTRSSSPSSSQMANAAGELSLSQQVPFHSSFLRDPNIYIVFIIAATHTHFLNECGRNVVVRIFMLLQEFWLSKILKLFIKFCILLDGFWPFFPTLSCLLCSFSFLSISHSRIVKARIQNWHILCFPFFLISLSILVMREQEISQLAYVSLTSLFGGNN